MKLNISKITEKLLLALIFVLPFNFHYIFNFSATKNLLFFKENFQYSLYYFDILFLLIFLIWIFQKFQFRKFTSFLTSNKILLLIIFYLIGSLILISTNLTSTLYNSLRLLEVLFFFLIFIETVKTKELFHKIIYLIFLSGVVQSIIALAQFIFQKSLDLKYLGESILNPRILGVAKIELSGEKFIRGYGTFPHPNLLGAFLFLALISGLYFVLNKNASLPFSFSSFKILKLAPKIKFLAQKIHFFSGLTLILIGILATFSRSVWLITAILSLYLSIRYSKYLFSPKTFLKLNFKIIFTVLAILAILFFSFYKFIPPRLCLGNCQDQSLTLRKNYSHFSQDLIKNNFWTGIGIGQFSSELKIINPTNLPAWDIQPVHNLYLLIWSEIGLIGFLLLFLFIQKNLNSLQKNPSSKIFILGILGFLILCFFDHYFWTLPQGQFIFWLALALLATSGRIRSSI